MTLKPDNLGVFEAPKDLPGAFCAVTQAVFEDEPCLILLERNLLSEEGQVKYRYQILRVIRDDRPADAYVCLGLAEDFEVPELDIPGAVPEGNGKYTLCNTVAELRDAADGLRGEKPREYEEPPMQEMWWERVDQKERFKNRPSTFGYGGQLVRPP